MDGAGAARFHRASIVRIFDVVKIRQPLVHRTHIESQPVVRGELFGVDLCCQDSALRRRRWYLLIQLFGNLDKTTAIDFPVPLQLAVRPSEFQQGSNQILSIMMVQPIDKARFDAIAIVQEL